MNSTKLCNVYVYILQLARTSYERTSKIEKLLFSLMVQRHVCTFRHVQRAAYRTAISAAQILVSYTAMRVVCIYCFVHFVTIIW